MKSFSRKFSVRALLYTSSLSALDLERLDLEEVVARAAGDYNGDEAEAANGEQKSTEDDDDDDADIIVEDDGDGKTDQNDNSMSVVQALAKGVEVAPSEGGKVSLFYTPHSNGEPLSKPCVCSIRTRQQRARETVVSCGPSASQTFSTR